MRVLNISLALPFPQPVVACDKISSQTDFFSSSFRCFFRRNATPSFISWSQKSAAICFEYKQKNSMSSAYLSSLFTIGWPLPLNHEFIKRPHTLSFVYLKNLENKTNETKNSADVRSSKRFHDVIEWNFSISKISIVSRRLCYGKSVKCFPRIVLTMTVMTSSM